MAKGKLKITAKMPRKYDFWLHLSALILILFGSLMILSTSVGNVLSDSLIIFKVVFKQTVFIFISYVMMLFLANNFTMVRARRLGKVTGIILILACATTLAFEPVNGSRAWIRIGSVTIQPSEFVKVFMVVIIGVYVEIAGRRKFDWWTIIKVPFGFFVIFIVVVVFQKDMGTAVIIALITAIVFLIPSHQNLRKLQIIMKTLIVLTASLIIFLMSPAGLEIVDKVDNLNALSHVTTRFRNASNPFEDPYDQGYQLIQGMVGIASGGITGKGIGESQQKFGFITQAENDFILAIIIEELGIFGLSIIVIGYIVILQRLFYYAFRTKSEGYKIILIGTAMYIFLHFFLNVGGVCGLIPLTGVPLLFISSGGSSLMAIMSGLGVSQAVISRIRNQGE